MTHVLPQLLLLLLPSRSMPILGRWSDPAPFLEAMAQGPAGSSGPDAESKARLLCLMGLALVLPFVWMLF